MGPWNIFISAFKVSKSFFGVGYLALSLPEITEPSGKWPAITAGDYKKL